MELKINNQTKQFQADALSIQALLDIEKKEIKGVIAHLRSLSPQSTMDRGYSVVQSDDGKIVRDATKLKAGAVLRIRAAKGEARANVLEPKPE